MSKEEIKEEPVIDKEWELFKQEVKLNIEQMLYVLRKRKLDETLREKN